MPTTAALGFRLHTGWAAVVAVLRDAGRFEVSLRRRIELLPSGDALPRFVYHEASKLQAREAAELVKQAEAASQQTARVTVKEILDHLRSLGLAIKTAGVPSGSRLVPNDLSAVLRSHPLIHAAEGALFRQAVASACEGCGLAVISVRERDVWLTIAGAWGLKEAELRKQVDSLRKSVGAPWGTDQKTATAFALLALRPGT
jgi:hypothetical protein